MDGQPAKILGGGEVRRVLAADRQRRYPDRNRVMVLLSVKAGLRACEIARLTWPMVTDAGVKIGTTLELPAKAAKKVESLNRAKRTKVIHSGRSYDPSLGDWFHNA